MPVTAREEKIVTTRCQSRSYRTIAIVVLQRQDFSLRRKFPEPTPRNGREGVGGASGRDPPAVETDVPGVARWNRTPSRATGAGPGEAELRRMPRNPPIGSERRQLHPTARRRLRPRFGQPGCRANGRPERARKTAQKSFRQAARSESGPPCPARR